MPILTPQERVGTVVAEKFELTSVLGRGGMGVVYEALHRWTGRRVAIKLIDPALADDPELATRFLHEARAAARLRHPNVVDVLDMGRSDDGTVYQVLALLEGETLGARLKRDGALPWDEALSLLAPIMDALEMAHGQGIVHRDVKPDNVFLRRGPMGAEPVLLDFGMAKLLDACPVTTNSSAVFGTPHYMAPEQALGAGKAGPAADIWSMGVMLFECLSGELPFGRGGPAAAYLARVVYEQAPSLSARCPELPATLSSLVDRALARDAEQRFASMAELLTAVRAAAAELGVILNDPRSGMSLVVPRRTDTQRKRWYALAGAAVAVAVAFGGFHTLRAAARNPASSNAVLPAQSDPRTRDAARAEESRPPELARTEPQAKPPEAQPAAQIPPAREPSRAAHKTVHRKRGARQVERAEPAARDDKPTATVLPTGMTEDY